MNSSQDSPASGATRDGLRNAPSDMTSTAAARPALNPGPDAPFAPTRRFGASVTWTRCSTLGPSSDARDAKPHGAPRPSGIQGPTVPRPFPSPPSHSPCHQPLCQVPASGCSRRRLPADHANGAPSQMGQLPMPRRLREDRQAPTRILGIPALASRHRLARPSHYCALHSPAHCLPMSLLGATWLHPLVR